MELRQLRYFQILAEELHFGRAAKRLRMTQPPLTQQIQHLEQEMGVLLFKRTKRHVELTKAGKVFLEDITQSLTQLDQAVENARLAQQGENGKLQVGFVGSATYDILPSLIREFQNRYPNVELRLEELSTPDQIEALYLNKLDIGFIRPPAQNDAICVEVVDETPCILAIPKQHPLTKLESIPVSMLKDQPFVFVSRNVWPGLYDDIVSLCEKAGFTPKIKQFAREYQTVIGLVAAGIGMAVVPASLQSLSVRDVEYREFAEVQLTVKMAIAYQENNLSPEAQNFIDLIHSPFHISSVFYSN